MQKKTALISGAAALVLVLGGVGIAVAVNADDDGRLTGTTLERASNAALAEVGTGTVTSAEHTNDDGASYAIEVRLDNGDEVDVELNDSFEVIWVGDYDSNDDDNNGSPAVPSATADAAADAAAAEATAAAAAAAAAEAAAATSGDARASAEAAALAAVGSGTVTEFDISDDNDHLYEVEVTLPSGEDRDVELDANFTVLRIDDVAR
ncbi:hypothetical protein E3T55_09945 [Cryobacterium frigoriphilum]|uniref:Uncharacterized protein n=1 Tax=Cryobacterium frigoriphilum TaxID=1259150 RepID=A0A4V6QI89_9MICO|nr:hypothetical protein [Cryobacterium frigoriphilum]TFD50218.1 hypothetical protein E3T55_09945 [Cryobacterium frigoriphilum]